MPSKTRNCNYNLIDFDESSKLWKSNKIYLGNGTYRYKKNSVYDYCIMILPNGKDCKSKRLSNNCFCRKHAKY